MIHFFSSNNKLLQETITKTQEVNKKLFDKKRRGELNLQPGNHVWLATTNLNLTCLSRKLGPKYVGPFPVKKKTNDVAYELVLPNSFRIHPVFHVKPAVPDPFPERNSGSESVMVDEEAEY